MRVGKVGVSSRCRDRVTVGPRSSAELLWELLFGDAVGSHTCDRNFVQANITSSGSCEI